jgi:hypothetical protein
MNHSLHQDGIPKAPPFERLPCHAPAEISNRVFIYLGKVAAENRWMAAPDHWNRTSMQVAMKLVTASVQDDDGKPISFEFSRLRPTVLTDVAETGGFAAARRQARHADERTTLGYIAGGTGSERVDQTIAAAQDDAIRCVVAALEGDVHSVAGHLGVSVERAEQILDGRADKLFSACKNDLESPVSGQASGRRCRAIWDCLACENHVILERHLPRLIAYQQAAITVSADLTEDEWDDLYGNFVTLADAAVAKFPATAVENARRKAELMPLNGCAGFRV